MSKALILPAAKLWRAHPRETAAMAALGLAAAAALAGTAYSTPETSRAAIEHAAQAARPPAPPPLLVRQLAPEDALSINRSIPIADLPNPAAKPFALNKADATSRARALECLTSAVYYEAGSESQEGQQAVAQVILNRVRHPAFPGTVCDVVFQGSTRVTGCQFTFTCDGSLARRPSIAGWAQARRVATAALSGSVYRPAGNATHYHAAYVVPYWASSLTKNAVVGAHIFYRWAGTWGRPAAFSGRYAGHEPNVGALRTAALEAEAREGTAEALGQIPGAELAKSADGRVDARFSVAARKAVEEAPHREYVDKFEASENLRWTLGGGAPSSEKPLGGTPPAASAAAGGGSGSGAGGGGAEAPLR
jgi:spore germination cell wall hydrolase CwlJ-like protein